MSYHEKWTWAFGVIAVVAYGGYLCVVAPQLFTTPVADIAYAVPLFVSIGVAIVAGIIAGIVLGIISGHGSDKLDERDQKISRFGDYTGNAVVMVAGIVAMVLAVLDMDGFWIANVIYLGFIVAAVLSSIAKIAAYRGGLPTW